MDKMFKQNIKVDAIITDPPYNVSRENNFKTIGRNGINFGDWDSNFNQVKWLKKINRILKPGGSVIIFNDWKNMGLISKELENQGFQIKDLIRWRKSSPMPRNVNRRYVGDAEYALWVVKPGKWTFNKPEGVHYLRPEILSGVALGKGRFHPTQKASKVIETLIETHTEKGDLIFDPFSGSGQISLSSHKLNRFFIGAEIDTKYWKVSKKRINDSLIKPAFNHLGNKYRMIGKLESVMPIKGIENFVDVFAGSCVVSASYTSAKKYYINDGDENLYKIINFLVNTNKKTIVEEIEKIVNKYKLDTLPYKEGYSKLKEKYNKTTIKNRDTRELLTLVLFGFNQQIRFNRKNEFNIPAGKTQWTDYQKEKIFKFVQSFENKNTVIRNDDFEDFVKFVLSETNKSETIFYFDPPYLITDATYNYSWTPEEETRLLSLLEKLTKEYKVKWILSNVLISKGKENFLLKEFIEKNKGLNNEKLNIIDINLNYSNSNYQRKSYKENDQEIILRNF